MAANGEVIRDEEELARLGGSAGDFVACSTSMVALLGRIRLQTPQTGRRTAATPEERRLFLLGAKALNYVAEAALKAFGQDPPQLGIKEWNTPRLRKPILSCGHAVARLSYMNISMDLLMALTQGDETKLDPPSEVYSRTAGADDSTLDGEETLLQAASELFQLSSATHINTYSYAQGFQVVLPAIKDTDRNWNAAAFTYMERTLTALAHSHSVWFSSFTSHFKVDLWGQPVPGTDVTKTRPYTGPAHATACALHKVQPTGKASATSRDQVGLWQFLRAGLVQLNATKRGMLQQQVHVAVEIVIGAVRGRHNGGTQVSREFSTEILNITVLSLEVLDRKFRAYFEVSIPLGTDIEAHQPSTDRGPRPKWQNSLVTRRWAILECLDYLFSKPGQDPTRLNTASSIIALCTGRNIADQVHRDHADKVFLLSVATDDWTQEWREEMMEYARLAIVGIAQFLSSKFDDADVKLGGEIVPKAKDREVWLRDRVSPRGD